MTPPFPLSAIVGQEDLVEALLVNAVTPEVGGVLIRGERGTAKSTAVRALAALLPPVLAAESEQFAFAPGERAPGGPVPHDAPLVLRPAPLVELPLGATLDRLLGALDLGRALAGDLAFEAGLLARAHQGILYVDEVNLLADHLVDALLDAAASAVARIERDAVSVEHDARFLLVGTMNAEEGELRPQLLDRFGLGVQVAAPVDPATRAEIVSRRLAYEHDPAGFAERWAEEERALAARITVARDRLDAVRLPERELLRITAACARLQIDGLRGDIVCARAARALAALAASDEVDEQHVRRAAILALSHRRHADPLDGRAPSEEDFERAFDGPCDKEPPPDGPSDGAPPPPGDAAAQDPRPDQPSEIRSAAASPGAPTQEPQHDPALATRERRDPPAPGRLPLDALRLDGAGAGPLGRRARAAGPGAGAIDSRPAGSERADLAIVASLRARLTGSDGDLREHVRAGRESALLCLVVDASGSMGARRRLARVKGALLAVLRDSYIRRDRVAIIAFRDGGAHLLVAPGTPLAVAAAAVCVLPTGGRTPLAAGLLAAERLVRREAIRDGDRRAIAVVLTDGRVADPDGAARDAAARLGRAVAALHVVDSEEGPVRIGLASALAGAGHGRLHVLITPTSARRAA